MRPVAGVPSLGVEPEQYEYSLHTNVISAGSFGSCIPNGHIIITTQCRPKSNGTVGDDDWVGKWTSDPSTTIRFTERKQTESNWYGR